MSKRKKMRKKTKIRMILMKIPHKLRETEDQYCHNKVEDVINCKAAQEMIKVLLELFAGKQDYGDTISNYAKTSNNDLRK